MVDEEGGTVYKFHIKSFRFVEDDDKEVCISIIDYKTHRFRFLNNLSKWSWEWLSSWSYGVYV